MSSGAHQEDWQLQADALQQSHDHMPVASVEDLVTSSASVQDLYSAILVITTGLICTQPSNYPFAERNTIGQENKVYWSRQCLVHDMTSNTELEGGHTPVSNCRQS